MFTGEKPEVSHLKIFGCLVYLHVPKEKRSKLDPSGKKGIFVGYSEKSKAYRIYIPWFYQIEISRDVTFDEDATFTKSIKIFVDEDHEEEEEAPRTTEGTRPTIRDIEEDSTQEDHDLAEPQGELVHTFIEGLISWRQVYLVRSGIHFLGLILLCDVCQIPMLIMLGWLWWPMLIMLGWLWWPMLISIVALIYVMTNQGSWCEDCCSCHALYKL